MDNKNRNISIQDIEEIHRKTEMIAGLSDFCVILFTNYFENDIFKRTLECLSDEVFKLRDECRALYNNIGSHNMLRPTIKGSDINERKNRSNPFSGF